MSSNKSAYPPLGRRRRRSDQLSPTSPSQARRLVDRPFKNSDAFGLGDTTFAVDNADSPTLASTLSVTSPFSDHLSSLPSASLYYKPTTADAVPEGRSSEENTWPTFRRSDEAARPVTAGLAKQSNAFPPSSAGLPMSGSEYASRFSRPSPLLPHASYPENRDRALLEAPIGYAYESSSPHMRTHSFSSQIPEDQSLYKVQAGKKSRMNLLNPMSLWARRRSSQNPRPEENNLSINTLSVPALPEFDPSIRGKVVHDFSAPRTRRQYSNNDTGSLASPALWSAQGPDSARGNDSPSHRRAPSGTPNLSHSPMFKEHFQEDRPALQPERTGYLHNIHAYHNSHDQQDPENVPAFARRLPHALPQTDLVKTDDRPVPLVRLSVPVVPPSEPSPPPPTPPPKGTPSPKFDAPLPAALPKHMTSTSSRFSFQIGGSGSSAQEKLLEDKHKEHVATRKVDDDDDDFDYDPDADDGLEEPIPGVSFDYDEDDGFGGDDDGGFGEDDDVPAGNALVARYGPPDVAEESATDVKTTTLHRQSLQGFHFTPQSLTFSPASTGQVSQPTPRDHEGFAIGIADSRESSQDGHHTYPPTEDVIQAEKVPMLGGLGITTAQVHRRRSSQVDRPQGGVFDDDELYFDDGEFGDLDQDPPDVAFDEHMFDDDSGQIRDIPADNARRFEAAKQASTHEISDNLLKGVDGLSLDEVGRGNSELMHSNSVSVSVQHYPQGATGDDGQVAGLTETNLAAYHDALALAANQAAANGRFDRKVSFSQISDATSQSPFEASQHVSDGGRFSHNYSSAIAEDDGFPFDDDMDDDMMIAEANAEALENDDDGFYGQEFGFYARSYGKGNTELTNGGFFAERGSSGIKRSHSGKANFQEPSLTPITERSEWSTRNSVVSLKIPGGLPASAQSMPSPGIAQILGEMDSPGFVDEDMSLTALMKLRGRAFGGSSSSLNSSAAGFSAASPLHLANNSWLHSDPNGGRMSSSMHERSPAGIPESEEEDEEELDSAQPTITQNTPRKQMSEPVIYTSQEELPSSPRRGHHSRTSSVESVSYARDSGGWVLERRRTDEDSGAEYIDREYLVGARI